ncbi:hypothetical protein SERLA73DRAFT_113385 [Serpula lacrymans var. lacrymans S7.3]|uniref:Mitochondrial distribution and morphology protein 12 n=1 Tax=Serpula lacrymans var. lacrymans (strain S7.3) TaxID=936435 RepID=F8Q806_SERL3|nr:hypothetical protein SERLA73DRAFT_113385 [Serpula lacrymans var. lacrymans S7.3]
MSIDLEWHKLDATLASSLIDALNRQLTTTTRPSFIGPVEVTSLDFGSASPDVELIDLRDIHPDFLEDDDDDDGSSSDHSDPVKVTEGVYGDDDDGFEWVSRRAARKGVGDDGPAYHHLPPHIRYGRGPSVDLFSSTPALHSGMQRDIWSGGAMHMSVPSLGDFRPLHLHITWHSNLRITLTTSLLINYPSPMFMALPIKLSVTGLVFSGEVAVAYEGARRRVHLCVLDDLDPYGPACGRSQSSTPPDAGMDESRPGKPLPVGQRLLPSILIESEIGQADKHVLKNVTRVERFIQDVIRKTVEEELVFPNFHTLIMGDE